MRRYNRHGKRMASVLDRCRPNQGVGQLKLLAATSDAEGPTSRNVHLGPWTDEMQKDIGTTDAPPPLHFTVA